MLLPPRRSPRPSERQRARAGAYVGNWLPASARPSFAPRHTVLGQVDPGLSNGADCGRWCTTSISLPADPTGTASAADRRYRLESKITVGPGEIGRASCRERVCQYV